ncbi:MAG: Sua5/YciO/YrdC/YwlC family protein [Saprospiraceae bacterium]|nr:Sua5/YciO/YrdC/YwlC family protein [Saprospiraceae bacterium]MDZ4704454.1 Sua5/YciO/YrdC/YwlC family protein [Saprospiraceae bacterium]
MTIFTNPVLYMIPPHHVEGALAAIENNGLVLCPTDTLWSIACDATDPVAVLRLLRLKPNAYANSFEILVDSIEMLRQYVEHLHPRVETLLSYHIRPLTVVFDKARNLPEKIQNPDGSVAVRIAQDEFCRDLIGNLKHPLVCTYAHLESTPMPTHFGAVSSAVIEAVDYVVRYRQNDKSHGQPSVMVRLLEEEEEMEFLRE